MTEKAQDTGKRPGGRSRLANHQMMQDVHTNRFTPRDYQEELLETALKKNTVVCLGTGAGKTFIAVMLIKEVSYKIRPPYDDSGQRTVFLVPLVPLVLQQAKCIEEHTDLTVGQYYGEKGVDHWTKDKWVKEFQENQVLVMTPDIFYKIVCHGFLPLSKVNLLIVDECHRAIKRHPYREIMKCIHNYSQQPRILGLSASLVNKNCKPHDLGKLIRNLEITMLSTVETASTVTSISEFGAKPKEEVHIYKSCHLDSEYLHKLFHHFNHVLDFINDVHPTLWPREVCLKRKHLKKYLTDLIYILQSMGPWCALKAARLFRRDIDKVLECLYSCHLTFAMQLFMLVSTVLELTVSLCTSLMEGIQSELRPLCFASPKLVSLLGVLKNYSPKKESASDPPVSGNNVMSPMPPLCGIVFVERRVVAELLNLWLNEVKQIIHEPQFLSSDFIVGHGAADAAYAMVAKQQEQVLEKFRNGEVNLLIATSVVEEGLNVRSCNLVIRYDKPSSFRSYIQSKGRARAEKASYVMLIEKKEWEKFKEELTDFQTIEMMLLKSVGDSNAPTEEEVDQLLDDLIPPYIPNKEQGTAARVTLASAISLVNRYCIKLPSDSFTKLAPQWEVTEVSEGVSNTQYQCTICLPINSPLKKPITGKPMSSKRLAKMAAAFETCVKLHQIGELDDNLIPIGKEAVKFEDEIEDFEEEVSISGKPGTTKRRQYYYKQVADALRGSLPMPGIPCYLYIFKMKLTCPIPEDQNTRGRKIHDPAETSRCFGILTTKIIPPICRFPVFTRSGEVTVQLEPIASEIEFTEDQHKKLSCFHRYTFANVLRLEKYPMLFDPHSAENSFYVVPLNSDEDGVYDVDWAFVDLISSQDQTIRSHSEEERKQFKFRTEDYVNAVVMPWYRNLDKPQFFYVAEICHDLNPRSDFPGEGFETFEKYYQSKYKLHIMNPDQPLLDVDHTSARLNLLTPRYVNRKGVTLPTSSEQTKKAKRENLQQKQILIPELCVIHPFPASLWRKAVCLPCVLYRVNSLLLAEQLRLTVAKEIGVGLVELPQGFEWPMLDFGWTLAEVLKAQAEQKEEEKKKEKNVSSSQHPPPPVTSSPAPPPPTANINQEGETDSTDFAIGTWSNDMADNIKDSDFYYGDNEEDEEVIQFLGGGLENSSSLWNRPQSDSPPMPVIRYGSPSNFEDSGWDAEWDMNYEDSKVFKLDIPGLGYISAPGIFNVEKLSMDLASCRDDDDEIWDSFDEDSIPDEFDHTADFVEEQNTSFNDTSTNNVTQKKPLFSRTGKLLNRNICESQLLRDSSPVPEEPCISPVLELEYNDPEIESTVSSLREKQSKNVESIMDTSMLNKIGSYHDKSEKDDEALMHLLNSTIDTEEDDESEVPLKSEAVSETKEHSFEASRVDANQTGSLLAFGELLPNREELAKDESSTGQLKFDHQNDLQTLTGPSPSIILQAFTMSNANDGINLERLETVGDSFLKYAITAYLFSTYHTMHEGRLSYLRSKQISNYNLYRLGKRKRLGELMIATKFEPNDNWLPPCYTVPKGLEKALIESGIPAASWNLGIMEGLTDMTEDQIRQTVMEKRKNQQNNPALNIIEPSTENAVPYIPYNLLTQHSIPDKSIADCVEALIGAYLISCGPHGALLFMKWLGLKVLLPDQLPSDRSMTDETIGRWMEEKKHLPLLRSPLLEHVQNAQEELMKLYSGLDNFENIIGYQFKDKAYLVQAFTHNSYYYNRVTDCYQRLEFLGDAVLDYLITRHLYEDPQKHSPGTLTDLRSALVNNTFFASLAVRYSFNKYLKILSPYLFKVVGQFVKMKEKSPGVRDYEAHYLEEDECENAEEVEVPKALGDIFESVAGAIYLDSGMSLDVVWKVYYAMMKPEIEYFSTHVPKSPIRELLEMEPQTAKFEKAEVVAGRKVRVVVSVVGKGRFVGIGRNKRIAKSTAAKRALRALKRMEREKDQVPRETL